jgi:hypothetical protein
MKTLQEKATRLREQHKLKFGTRSSLPDDRTVLQKLWTTSDGNTIGEGSVVRFVGFVWGTKKEGKESVNCSVSAKKEDTDVHIVLTENPGDAECESISAEMIPHLRPATWTSNGVDQWASPVRITGQLFFDASHSPCSNGVVSSGNPARSSNWEIHPVYAIDVCDNESMGGCPFNDDSVWTPLDQAE